jgi:triosephosphate isomerase
MHNKIIVANWKMQLGVTECMQWCMHNKQDIALMAQKATVVICPPFPMLLVVGVELMQQQAFIGAQDCSAFEKGAHTGQVAAHMLAEVGCKYVMVGHSERRLFYRESDEEIAYKAIMALVNRMTPIVCVGENKEQLEKGQTFDVLERQLMPLVQKIGHIKEEFTFIVAYEPVWAIGSGQTPSKEKIDEIVQWVIAFCKKNIPSCIPRVLYGGSVDEKIAESLSTLEALDGLLVGGASLDFQKFKNIVSLFR